MDQDIQKTKGVLRSNIITMFSIDEMPEDKQEEFVGRIGKIIFENVLLRVLPLMDDADLDEYEKLVEGGVAPDVLMDFFFDKVPGFLDIIAQETENFSKEAGTILKQLEK